MKRLLSLILAISMMISLFPTISATGITEMSGIKVVYDISSYVGVRNDLSVPFSSLTYEKTKGFWAYAANRRQFYSWTENGKDNITTSGEDLNWVNGKGIAIRDRNNWWAIKINVPESGYYTPKAYYGTYRNGGFKVDMNYYTLPVTANGVSVDLADSAFAIENNLIGSINCTDTAATDITMCETPHTFKARYFEKGEHYIIFYPTCTDEGKTGTLRGLVSDFVLDGGDKAVPMDIEISGEEVGDLDATVYLSDGTTIKDVTYKSENEEIATINENGVITVFEDATVGITVSAENDGYSLSKTFDVAVKKPAIPGISVTYDIASRVGSRNDTTVKFSSMTYESNNNLWAYAANRRLRYSWAANGYDSITTSGEDLNYLQGKGLGIRVRSNWWAIKIQVPETGIYLPKMSYITYTNTGTIDGGEKEPIDVYMQYYLIPKTEEVGEDGVIPELAESKFIGGEHLIGMLNATDTESSLVKVGYLPKINIQKGEYYLVFNPVTDPALAGKTISGTMRAGAGNVTLDGINCIQELYVDAKSDLVWDEESQISISAIRLDGTEITDYQVTYSSSNPEFAYVDKNGVIKGIAEGKATITVTVSDGIGTITKEIPVTVTDHTGAKKLLYNLTENLYVREKLLLDIDAVMNSGNVLDVGAEYITYTCEPESVARIEDGIITAVSEGEATVTTTVNFRGLEKTFENTVTVIADEGKTAPTMYTYEMREIALENIAKYDWAKTTQKNSIKAADTLLQNVEVIKNQIYGEGIPRANQLGVRGDDYYQYCRYCHEIVVGDYDLATDFTSRPWKVQCTACKRLFPTNDFESFLKLGLDESGRFFDVDRARQAHHEMLFHKDGSECTCEKPTEEKEETPEWYIFYGYGNPEGYLYNDLYGEIRDSNTDPWGELITWNKETIINEEGKEEIIDHGADLGTYTDENGNVLWQGGDMWGVDDGWGYRPGRIYTDGLEERIGYIARYHYEFWMWMYSKVGTFADAYIYTGDIKYGRAGAVLLDRIADIWPSFDMYYFRNMFFNTHGGAGTGAAVGRINDSYIARGLLNSADKLYPMIEDDELIRTLAEDAEKSGLENDKKSSESIWKNWEEGIVLECFQMLQDGRIYGNFGQQQGVGGLAAIVVGKQPETNNILNWIYSTNEGDTRKNITGGDLNAALFNRVDRDGMGDEASPRYNTSWVTNLLTFANATAMYTGEGNYQPFKIPKFVKMYSPQIDILIQNSKHPNIGDAGSVATVTLNGGTSAWLDAFAAIDNEEYRKKIANYLYTVNGNKTTGYKYDIFTENPESAEEDIMKYVDPEQKTESTILTGYGIAILRDGAKYDSASDSTATNNMRDIWVTFGRSASHGHNDALNLGMDAYGLDIAPDLGYPEATSYTPNRSQWVSAAISHNTVVVNEANHDLDITHGYPLHFDDTEMVKLIDVDESNRNSQTEKYRRSVVMIKANDDVSYAVDFFRVKGGNTHTYSFHSQAENAYPISGIELTEQKDENGNWIGTYAGVDGKDPETGEWIEYGPDPWTKDEWGSPVKYNRGYTWMDKIRRDKDPEQNISIEFDVQDYNKILKDGKGIKLRLTQMNNFTPDEVAIVAGYVPIKDETKRLPRRLDYMLVHNRGENLDSLFTTVLEPYKGERYVSDIKMVDVSVKTGTEIEGEDMARAVKVSHTNGRCDYVVYASNTGVTYTVSDTFVKADGTEIPISFDFRGFVGVYTVNENGACIYRYVNDGDIISNDGRVTGKTAAYTGTVTGFQKENDFKNYIDVEMQCDDLNDLEGRVIYVDNDRVENGAYRILSASTEGEGLKDGSIRLDIGTVTLIRSLIDEVDFDKGFVYNIKEGQTFSIPTTFEDKGLPVFEPVSDNLSTSAGSSIVVNISAKSPIETDTPTVTYIGTTLPRGASIDAETGVFTWKPTSSQVGDNHVAITARDSDGREATIHFDISVYGSTTGSKNEASETPETGTSDTPAGGGGGGGGGGGAAPTDKPDDENDTSDKTDDESLPIEEKVPSEGEADEVEKTQFTDLSNHAWAEDAINTLAVDGIIKGTTASTYSPANNITRADFALLLVRAFDLSSENTENFADVSASDYFAAELAIARNTGIVNGIGDNKFAPRNTITRQDMMVIVYRALEASLALKGSEAERNVGAAMNDSPVDYQNRDVTEPGEMGPSNDGGGIFHSQYPDFDTVADYARDAVSALIGAGLVNGKSGRIAPTDYTTRAEVAVLIKRILDYCN